MPSPAKEYDTISPTTSHGHPPRSESPVRCLASSDTKPADVPCHGVAERQGDDPRRSRSAEDEDEDEDADEEEREAAAAREDGAVVNRGPWLAFWDRYGSVELENKGSVARDHLALERTFLAWLRTSFSFAGIGIAITQLFRLNTSIANRLAVDGDDDDGGGRGSTNIVSRPVVYSPARRVQDAQMAEAPYARMRHLGKPLGATFIAVAMAVLLIGFHRYFEAQHYIIRGKFPASRGSIVMVSLISGTLIATSLILVLVTAPTGSQK